ncbi:MAG: SoxY-related arm protein [Betaproteobacteria bacterium]|nr:SoxY-related arm protein [Betaproteobacteria bacterium]
MTAGPRRRFLAAAGGLAAVAAWPLTAAAQLNRTLPNNMPQVIARLVGQSKVNPGRIKLSLPPLVENGHLVPLSVTVDSPMTEADHVKAIHVFTDKNPLPEVLSFYLGPRAGRANLSTRVRLADSETVVAIAQMSDGSFWSESVHVVVTTAACLEEL